MRLQDALAARTMAVPFPGTASGGDGSGGRPADGSSFPDDARAVIYCPAPPVTSAGRRGATEWVLAFEPRARPFVEPLMGWIGGADPLSHVRLRFPNREAAIAYARGQGLAFEVREPTHVHRGGLVRVPMRDVGDASPGVRRAGMGAGGTRSRNEPIS
jgi:ETC complex I subunit conserved region